MFRVLDHSISKKLTWMNMLVSGAALLLACAALFAYDLITFRQIITRQLSIQAQIIESNSLSALVFDDADTAQTTLSALKASPNILTAGIYRADGSPFAVYWRDQQGDTPVLPSIPAGQTHVESLKDGGVILVRRIVLDGKPAGTVYIWSDLREVNDRLKRYGAIVALVLSISLIAALFISRKSQRTISGPIVELANIARTVSQEKNYSVRASPSADGAELTVLIDSFNEMLEQIQQRDGALQKARDELEQRVLDRTTELAASEERLRLVVSAVKDYSILTLDPQGAITTWNAGAEHLKGYRAEEIVGRNFSCFYPAEDIQKGKPSRELKIAREEGHCEDEGWRVRKDGSRFWASVIITALRDDQGRLRGFGKVTRDMTARKQFEEELLFHSTQLEAANQELEAFSYSVSHDLRAPLRSIDGFSEILLEDYADKLDADGKEHLHRVRLASQHMSVLIDDLLKLSRITRTTMLRERLDLGALAKTIAEEFHETEPARHVEFVIGEGLMAEGDAGLLRIVMENLLGNAWKYTSRNESARIEFGAHPHNGRRAFFVRDDGAGFDQQYAGRLFGAFQRLHSTAEFPGTGIGLATVQRILRRHSGEVWAEGAVGKGATFYFAL